MSGGESRPRAPVSVSAALPRRFYKHADVAEGENGRWNVVLDGRPARTPGKRSFSFPSRVVAAAIAEEWQAQGERIDPSSMPMTRLANSIIDGVVDRMPEVRAEIVKYAASDLVCYRAAHPEDLAQLQAQYWDPVLSWARQRMGARFQLAAGIMPVAQPAETLVALDSLIAEFDAWTLGALHVMTTLTGSALLALAHVDGVVDLDAVWAAAHVDEDYQISKWGEDAEAMEKRARRRLEMAAASRIARLARDDGES